MSTKESESAHIALNRPGSKPDPAITAPGLTQGRQAMPLSVPLPFLLTAISAAALFSVLLPWNISQALLAPNFPHVLALVHMLTLGFLTMAIMGASLQLVPVIIAGPLRAARLLRWQYPIYASGVVLLISGFWWMLPALLIVGGSLIVLAVFHYIIVLAITFARADKRPLTVYYLMASLVYLGIVVCLGLTAALNFQFGFLAAGADRLLLAHITLGVVGWLTTTLMGVSYTLVRLFALAHRHGDRLGRIIFWLLNTAIVGLALGFSFAWLPLIIAGGLVLIAAAWLFGYDYLQMLRARYRKVLDVTQHHAIASVVYLMFLVPFGISAAIFGWGSPPLLSALGLAALLGWLGQSIMGYLYKIVPFLIWHERYGSLVGKQKVPLMREMVHERWAWISWWCINAGLIALIAAFLLNPPLWIAQCASAVLAGGCILAMLNVLGVVRHLKLAS
ncbi:MAG: hypothetical protein ACRDIV_08510 [Ktedonobacteraceae bacterium]